MRSPENGGLARGNAFTLVELLVSTAVLVLLVGMIGVMFSGVTAAAGRGNKHMDADEESRAVFDRMTVDFTQMVKRSDVDYLVKTTTLPTGPDVPVGAAILPQVGNDQIAFYSQVPGFYSASSNRSPVSLVGYRVNSGVGSGSKNMLERLGTGLLWNSPAATNAAMVFLPLTIGTTWPESADTRAHPNYELAGPQVFRVEYYYILKGQSPSLPSILSTTPWDTRSGIDHTWIDGMKDVAAIVVTIAVMDAKSRSLVTEGQLTALAGTMLDFSAAAMADSGSLETQWQSAIDSAAIPKAAAEAIRIYSRVFYLNSVTDS